MNPRRIGTTLKSEALLRLTPKYSNILFVRSRSLCFFPIPKNANSYLKALVLYNDKSGGPAFHPQQTTALAHLRSTQDRYKLDSWSRLRADDVIKFAVLRNPYSRLVSCFVDKLVKPLIANGRNMPLTFAETSDVRGVHNFRDFVSMVCQTPDYRRDRHVRSQTHFLYRFANLELDHVGTVERLDSTISFLKSLGLSDLPDTLHDGITKRTQYGGGFPLGERMAVDFNESDFLKHGIPPVQQFVDEELELQLRTAFREDYEIWHRAMTKSGGAGPPSI